MHQIHLTFENLILHQFKLSDGNQERALKLHTAMNRTEKNIPIEHALINAPKATMEYRIMWKMSKMLETNRIQIGNSTMDLRHVSNND